MTTKILEVVVCDLCKADRPAIARIEIDVCGMHDAALEAKIGEVRVPCEHCGRTFKNNAGLGRHRATAHPEG